jgi:hypothetical protein
VRDLRRDAGFDLDGGYDHIGVARLMRPILGE